MSIPTRLALSVMALSLAAGGCASPGNPETNLSLEQVCLAHFENDPAERDRCRVDASLRHDTAPDVRPDQLPLRTGQISD